MMRVKLQDLQSLGRKISSAQRGKNASHSSYLEVDLGVITVSQAMLRRRLTAFGTGICMGGYQ